MKQCRDAISAQMNLSMRKQYVETIQRSGRICHIYEHNTTDHDSSVTLFWCTQAKAQEETAQLARILCQSRCALSWRLVAVEADDWFAAYSPWKASGCSPKGDFAGDGPETLRWFAQEGVPALRKNASSACVIGGYSLGGLFALWAFYESNLFAGAASCSGSLWYPGWDSYANLAHASQPAAVYLSLGRKEPQTRHPFMSQVGCATQAQLLRLQADQLVYDCTLQWNAGGHFTQPLQRMGDGFSWLMQRIR